MPSLDRSFCTSEKCPKRELCDRQPIPDGYHSALDFYSVEGDDCTFFSPWKKNSETKKRRKSSGKTAKR